MFESLVLREPLVARPFLGAILGGVLGMVFGGLAAVAGFEGASESSMFFGYAAGGGLGGLLVGASLPLFRSRLLASLIVGIGSGIWGLVSMRFAGEEFSLISAAFIAVLFGALYGVTLWDYRER